ncbi:MAG: hypothetical protein V4463_17540 [Pseudomonadota bacterium]
MRRLDSMPDYARPFAAMLDVVAGLIGATADRAIAPGEEWLYYRHVLALKLLRHLQSLLKLEADQASCAVLARAAIDSYLHFHFLFGSGDAGLAKFRFNAWRLNGMAEGKKLKKPGPPEKQEMQELQQWLKGSPLLAHYAEADQKKLLRGEWQAGHSWDERALAAGLGSAHFRSLYLHLGGYSQTSFTSAMQIAQSNLSDSHSLGATVRAMAVAVMTEFATVYAGLAGGARLKDLPCLDEQDWRAMLERQEAESRRGDERKTVSCRWNQTLMLPYAQKR